MLQTYEAENGKPHARAGAGKPQAQPAQKTPPAQAPEGVARRRSHCSGGPVSRAPEGREGHAQKIYITKILVPLS